jgi:prophage regulatory protein
MEDTQTNGERLLRLPDVEARTGLRKSAIYAGMKAGTFPACIKLGPRAAAWPESDIAGWIAAKIRSARGAQS